MWNFCVWALDPNVWGCSWALGKSCFSPVRDTKLNIEFVPDKSHFLQLPFPCQELPLPKVMQLRFLGICRGSWVVFGLFFILVLVCCVLGLVIVVSFPVRTAHACFYSGSNQLRSGGIN